LLKLQFKTPSDLLRYINLVLWHHVVDTAQQAHPQPGSSEQRTTHKQHTTCCHSTKL